MLYPGYSRSFSTRGAMVRRHAGPPGVSRPSPGVRTVPGGLWWIKLGGYSRSFSTRTRRSAWRLYKKIALLRSGWIGSATLEEKRKALRLQYASTDIPRTAVPARFKEERLLDAEIAAENQRWTLLRRNNCEYEENDSSADCRTALDLKGTAFACRWLRSVIYSRNLVGK